MKFLLLNLLAAAILIGIYLAIRLVFRDKKRIMKKVLFLAAIVLAVSCSKSTDPAPTAPATKAQVKFYSTNAVTAAKVITIVVGNKDYGRVKYSASMPTCEAAGFASIQLAPGNYVAEYYDVANPNANKQVPFAIPQSVTKCIFFDLK